jgi:hypothetical protein
MPKRPLLFGADGLSTLVAADDSEDKLRALCLASFGALKALAKNKSGVFFVEDPDELERYREYVARKIVEVMGKAEIEKAWNVRLSE